MAKMATSTEDQSTAELDAHVVSEIAKAILDMFGSMPTTKVRKSDKWE